MTVASTLTIFNFGKQSDLSNWYVVDDVVMGGRSNGNFTLSEDGHGLFQGRVSLENNGGFSMVRYVIGKSDVSRYSTAVIRLKGDGKRYQFRIKSAGRDRHSYIAHFQTSGEWETIKIPLAKMYASFRGVKLNMPDYPGKQMEEIAFLIGNKKAEEFRLEIDKIELE